VIRVSESSQRTCKSKYDGMRRWIVSTGVIAGVVLVFVLLGYLIYALINAEAF